MKKQMCLGLIFALLFAANSAMACTGITLRAKDGSVVFTRSLEWGASDLKSELIIIPRGMKFQGTLGKGLKGMKWDSKYGAVGTNALGLNILLDGTNEKGLHAGLFYFPGYTWDYPEITQKDADHAMAPWEFVTWILTRFATVDEARAAIAKIKLGPVGLPGFPGGSEPIPVHAIVVGPSGKSIVIEPVGGELKIHDNPLGVIANSPTFDWHMTNLNNYVKLSPYNAKPEVVDGVKIAPLGQGSGMLGLPGDITSPSRFVRAVALGHAAETPANAMEAIMQAVRVMNAFFIVKGYVREPTKDGVLLELTQWETFSDLTNKKVYFRTYENPAMLRMVDINRLDLDAAKVRKISMDQKNRYIDLTDKATD